MRRYEFSYRQDEHNGVSLLTAVSVVGFDAAGVEHRDLPAVRFGYDRMDFASRQLVAVEGADPPSTSLRGRGHELVNLTGSGLPDVLQLDGVARWWRNLGGGTFDLPRPIPPGHSSRGEPDQPRCGATRCRG